LVRAYTKAPNSGKARNGAYRIEGSARHGFFVMAAKAFGRTADLENRYAAAFEEKRVRRL